MPNQPIERTGKPPLIGSSVAAGRSFHTLRKEIEMNERRVMTTLLSVIAVCLALIVLKLYSSDLVTSAYAQPETKAQEIHLMGYSGKDWVRVRVDSEGRLLTAPVAQSAKKDDATEDVRVTNHPLIVRIADDQKPIAVNLVYENNYSRWEPVEGEEGALFVHDRQ
jgi:hypothetical protein